VRIPVTRIARIRVTAADVEELAAFYTEAFGFERRGVGQILTLALGREIVELEVAPAAGSPYPRGRSSNDPWFQHFAIVVSDMAAARARLGGCGGWTPITVPAPQRLPASSGGVMAFKFRDPEGHPLELLEFSAGEIPVAWRGARGSGPCLGIDHSAIVVADTSRSVDFYGHLGFSVTGRSLNRGPEQEHLDGLSGVVVEVTALAGDGVAPLAGGGADPPHLELLRYRSPVSAQALPGWPAPGDIAATWLHIEVDDLAATLSRLRADGVECLAPPSPSAPPCESATVRDPDGHLLRLLASRAD
jgi:catechol 2,3-dioxygenase-like lactoylglutathione lyase family enzyme